LNGIVMFHSYRPLSISRSLPHCRLNSKQAEPSSTLKCLAKTPNHSANKLLIRHRCLVPYEVDEAERPAKMADILQRGFRL
jgi:hypothetical protein